MRKRIALVVALVMILSLVPMSAFAASDNSIDRVPTVADDREFKFGDTDVPNLIIEDAGATVASKWETETFRLNLSNAEFLYAEFAKDAGVWVAGEAIVYPIDMGDYEISRRTATSATITIFGDGAGAPEYVEIPLYTELQGEGEARVSIVSDVRVDSQTLTFAVGAKGATVASVSGKKTVTRGTGQEAGTILIDETTAGAIKAGEAQEFRLRLPKNVKWNTATEVDFTEWGFTLGDIEPLVTMTGNDGRDLVVNIPAGVVPVVTVRSTIFVRTVIDVSRSASFGDIAVSLTGLKGDVSSASGLVIATYKDYGFTVEVEDDGENEFFTGRWDEDYTVEVTIERDVAGSFLAGREIDFDVPDWVWITDVTAKEDALQENIDFKFAVGEDNDGKGDNKFFYEVKGDEKELVFELQFTLEGTAAVDGPVDIPLTVAGAGVPEQEVVLGVAKPAVMIEVGEQPEPILAGLQRQAAPEITITETEAAAIREGDLVVFMRDYFQNSMRVDSFSWEVVEGDIEIDDDSTAGGNLTLEIGAESEEASVIRLYNIQVTLDRTVPIGPFRADIGGDALVDNTDDDFEDREDAYENIRTDFVPRVARFTYVTVSDGALAGEEEAVQVAFTIGQAAYWVDGEMMMMDVAPFIMNDRTMIPVRYLEELFGMQPVWNPTSRTVTVMYEGKVFEMAIGSNVMRVNGAPYMEMDAEATIVNDRTFVPASRFARAMGIPYTWDAATQTATFN